MHMADQAHDQVCIQTGRDWFTEAKVITTCASRRQSKEFGGSTNSKQNFGFIKCHDRVPAPRALGTPSLSTRKKRKENSGQDITHSSQIPVQLIKKRKEKKRKIQIPSAKKGGI